jgi:TPR repeat protein
MLRIQPSPSETVLEQTFTLSGTINIESISALETLYVLPQYCTVELDFSNVQRVNSMGLAQLLKLFEYWQRRYINIYIKNPNRMITTLFKMTGLTRFLSTELVISTTKDKTETISVKDATKTGAALCHRGKDYYDKHDYASALAFFNKAAQLDDATGQFYLGLLYAQGNGVEKDYNKAVEWFKKAALQGNARGQYNLGVMYNQGNGVEKDYHQAITWYRKAAIRGDVIAQAKMGFMYENGYGTPKDMNKAIDWYRKAASQNEEYAIKRLKVLDNPPL